MPTQISTSATDTPMRTEISVAIRAMPTQIAAVAQMDSVMVPAIKNPYQETLVGVISCTTAVEEAYF